MGLIMCHSHLQMKYTVTVPVFVLCNHGFHAATQLQHKQWIHHIPTNPEVKIQENTMNSYYRIHTYLFKYPTGNVTSTSDLQEPTATYPSPHI